MEKNNLHPVGHYQATILDHGFSEAKTGTPQFWAVFETEVGNITGFFPLTEKAAESSLQKIVGMGYTGSNLGELADGQMLLGLCCVVTVKHDTWQGETRDKIAWVNPVGWEPGPKRDENVAVNVSKFNGLMAKIQAGKTSDLPF